MSRTLLAILCLSACTLVTAQVPNDEVAYSVGVRLGERLHAEMPELQLAELLEGLRAAYHQQPLRLSQTRIEQVLINHEAHVLDPARAQAREALFLQQQRELGTWHALPSGLLVEKLATGSGPSNNSRVLVTYRGTLADGRVFDESQTAHWFNLQSLIEGWRQALLLMPVGSRWRLLIPSSLAYAAEGSGDLIPPYSPLIFELELLHVSH